MSRSVSRQKWCTRVDAKKYNQSYVPGTPGNHCPPDRMDTHTYKGVFFISMTTARLLCNAVQQECVLVKRNSRGRLADLPRSLYRYSDCPKRSRTFQHKVPSKTYRGVEVYISFLAYFAYFEEMKVGLVTSMNLQRHVPSTFPLASTM